MTPVSRTCVTSIYTDYTCINEVIDTQIVAQAPLLRFVVDLLYGLLCNKSATNRSNEVWAITTVLVIFHLYWIFHIQKSRGYPTTRGVVRGEGCTPPNWGWWGLTPEKMS